MCIRCDRVDGFPCLVGGQVRRAGDLRRPGARHHDNVTLRDRRARATAGDRSRPDAPSPGWSTELEDGSMTTLHRRRRRRRVRRGQLGGAAAAVGQRPSPRRARRTAPASSGRHYMRHNNLALMAVSHEPNPTRFQKTLAMNDWYLGADDWDYPLGGIQMLGKSDEEQIHAQAPRWAGKPVAGPAVRGPRPPRRGLLALRRGPSRARTTGSRSTATAASTSALDEKQQRRGRQAAPTQAASAMLGDLGHAPAPPARPQHLPAQERCLSARPRTRPAPSASAPTPPPAALDVNCKAHDLDNLYVVDTSFFPSIGAVNPSLTAIANALRVGDHLLERLQ